MSTPSLPPAWQLYLKDHRVSTFKNWPFLEGCACTPERMAAAGFIHCPTENEPDLAQCFFCFKELEGWEPDDDPIEEHKKHSSGCAFLSVKKQFEELTLSEFLKLDKERAKNKISSWMAPLGYIAPGGGMACGPRLYRGVEISWELNF
ncbi:baculoviral IAP repeat-containing protein 5 isoform X2 [Globicephala melas]|uniref:baculoviral IAP repeat-containing protein 5 isoform X2 n=1 Tax=Globicephala melas TaxID=9731 RepID=UPI00293D7FCB|nr:baculoviral IAP repeat-containing protein 5 isoform X2 [Globicephala melas]